MLYNPGRRNSVKEAYRLAVIGIEGVEQMAIEKRNVMFESSELNANSWSGDRGFNPALPY